MQMRTVLQRMGIKLIDGYFLPTAIMFGFSYHEEHPDTGYRCIEIFFGFGTIGIHF
jgi:hypothetical protein